MSLTTIERALALALECHARAKDKAGAPYVLHPLRVMFRMKTEDEMTTAVLHDVVEEGGSSLEELRRQGFSEEVVAALDCLTRNDGQSYEDYIEEVRRNPLAARVKLADLEDNMDLSRIAEPDEDDFRRLEKYKAAHLRLKSERD